MKFGVWLVVSLKGRSYSTARKATENGISIRHSFSAELLKKKEVDLFEHNRCFNCFMTKGLCICSQTKAIYTRAKAKLKTNITVLMHCKEWGRASNTGKLMAIGMPETTSTVIFGSKSDEERMIKSFSDSPVLILYPSATSRPITEYKEWFQLQPTVTLCVLDSTWTQSGALNKLLPENIPRVWIDDQVDGPSLFLNRKQSETKTKVSTIEAVALALSALGEDSDAVKPLYESLQLSVDAVLQLRGRDNAYGNRLVNADSKPTVAKPTVCPLCSATAADTAFKNMGLHPLASKFAGRSAVVFESAADENIAREVAASALLEVTQVAVSGSVTSSVTVSSEEAKDLGRVPLSEMCRTWKCQACKGFFEQLVGRVETEESEMLKAVE